MTQTLQQAVQVLQMSTLELQDFLINAVTDNPLLEWPQLPVPGNAVRRQSGVGRVQDIALQAVARSADLHSVLHEQLHVASVAKEFYPVVAWLIDQIDERGYLPTDLDVLFANRQVSEVLLNDAIAVVQGFDPAGVGARTLQECLTLQLLDREKTDLAADSETLHLAINICKSHLELLATGQLARVQAYYQCDWNLLEQAVAVIRTLNPHPGLAYSNEQAPYVIPDLAILPTDQQLVVIMYDHAFPALRFNDYYKALNKQQLSAEDRDFFMKKTTAAINLLRSVEARRRTVFRVTEALAEVQQDFFMRGKGHLKPLTMKAVAERLNLHESTISRAVAGKFAETPHGIIELKTLFSTALHSTSGDQVSAASVRQQLKQWIAEEDATRPLTDQGLAERFANAGVQVSRRTIAKYRDELYIPSSTARKRKMTGNPLVACSQPLR